MLNPPARRLIFIKRIEHHNTHKDINHQYDYGGV